MTIIELLNDYSDNKVSGIETIRTLSGIFNPDIAIDLLAIINRITRVEQGEMSKQEFKDLL